MAEVMVRDGPGDSWRPVNPLWQNLHSSRAEEIVDHYNSKDVYSKEYRVGYEDWETPNIGSQTGDAI